MTFIKKLPLLVLFALIAFVSGLSSCSSRLSVEKRHFRPGYHVEFAPGKKNAHSHGQVEQTVSDSKEIDRESIVTEERVPESCIPHVEYGSSQLNMDAGATADIEKIERIGETTEGDTQDQGEELVAFHHKVPYGKRAVPNSGVELLDQLHRLEHYPLGPDDQYVDTQKKTLRIMGIVLIGVGLILFLLVSWLIGLILMLGGIAMVIAGAENKAQKPVAGKPAAEESKAEWQDVVYLKNGSVIRGMIVEQVPNMSLKIMTADGSVFVYEMEQVAKITKEQKLK
jgi:hypothetical protein